MVAAQRKAILQSTPEGRAQLEKEAKWERTKLKIILVGIALFFGVPPLLAFLGKIINACIHSGGFITFITYLIALPLALVLGTVFTKGLKSAHSHPFLASLLIPGLGQLCQSRFIGLIFLLAAIFIIWPLAFIIPTVIDDKLIHLPSKAFYFIALALGFSYHFKVALNAKAWADYPPDTKAKKDSVDTKSTDQPTQSL